MAPELLRGREGRDGGGVGVPVLLVALPSLSPLPLFPLLLQLPLETVTPVFSVCEFAPELRPVLVCLREFALARIQALLQLQEP